MRSRFWVLVALVGTCHGPVALAQHADADRPPAADLDGLIARLGAPDWAERDTAQVELLTGRHTLRDLEPYLSSDLTIEQRTRLTSIAFDRFLRGDRPAMGINMQEQSPGRIQISAAYGPPFDADRVLRPGDIILSFDGSAVPNQAAFRSLIMARDPGDVAELVLLRDGSIMNAQVRLGLYSHLPQQRGPVWRTRADDSDSEGWARAWSVRLSRVRVPEPEAIDPGLDAAVWRPALGGSTVRRADGGSPGDAPVVVGGQARTAGADATIRAPDPTSRAAAAGATVDRLRREADLRSNIDRALAEVAAIDAQLDEVRRGLAREGLTDALRSELIEREASLSRQREARAAAIEAGRQLLASLRDDADR